MNLAAGLNCLRLNDATLVLWVDALCIDQASVKEKNHQVPFMKRIYSQAAAVLVWLGGEEEGSDETIALLERMAHHALPIGAEAVRQQLTTTQIELLIRFFERSWWSRAWVQQEVALNKCVVFYCGSTRFSWNDLPTADRMMRYVLQCIPAMPVTFLRNSSYKVGIVLTRLRYFSFISRKPSSPQLDFFRSMIEGAYCEATDRRDLVYGFLGLADDEIRTRILPDYHLRVRDVYRAAATELLRSSEDLKILSFAGLADEYDSRSPSWVPNWALVSMGKCSAFDWGYRYGRASRQQLYAASAGYKRVLKILDPDFPNVCHHLKVSGLYFEEIRAISSNILRYDSTKEALLDWGKVSRVTNPRNGACYIGGGRVIEAYHATVIGDLWDLDEKKDAYGSGWRKPSRTERNYYTDYLESVENGPDLSRELMLFNSSLLAASQSQRFFRTKRGYLGTGPASLKPGDQIFILAGGRVPFVLRSHYNLKPHTYSLVGDCYVHGIMHGEAVAASSPKRRAKDRLRKLVYGGVNRDPLLPLTNFEDVYIT